MVLGVTMDLMLMAVSAVALGWVAVSCVDCWVIWQPVSIKTRLQTRNLPLLEYLA